MPRILVIDDSKLQRTYARMVLEDQGYDVLEAVGGQEGLELLRTGKPDCVLLDLLMPEVSGLDVLRTLKQEGHSVPVIVLTADDRSEEHAECLQLGAAAVVDKPRKPEQLVETVLAVLSRAAGGDAD